MILLPVLLVAGIWLGGHPQNLPKPVRSALVGDEDGAVYEEAVDTLQRDYYRNVDRKELLDQSLEHAVRSLDARFSNYFAPRDFADFQEATEGRFEGVGMTVEKVDSGLRVIAVYDDSPAARGGLKPGDVITHINGQRMFTQQQAMNLVASSQPGTRIKIRVARANGTTFQTEATLEERPPQDGG